MAPTLLVFIVILGVACAATFKSGLRVRYKTNGDVGNDSFYEMPRTVGNATAMGWSKYDRPTSPLPTLVMYCYNPPHVCCLYDPKTKYIAGIQVAFPLNEFYGQPFDWKIQGFIPWTRAADNCTGTVTYMTKQLYFISEATLKKSKKERMRAMWNDIILQEDEIWPVGFNQKRIAIPTNDNGILNAGFTKQRCIPWQGTHYVYNMTAATECLADKLLNWFPLVDNDSQTLTAIGLIVFGVMPEKVGERYHFERPSKEDLQYAVPDCPECFANLAGDPTSTLMHIYFVDEPSTIQC